MKQLVVFAGTVDGRLLAQRLSGLGIPILLCVATEYGARLAKEGLSGATVREGRMSCTEMQELFNQTQPSMVVDATHPYAKEVGKNIRSACETCGIRYLRLLRTGWEQQRELQAVDTMEQAAAFLADHPGKALLTVGSKELAAFTKVPDYQKRLFARVLPSTQVVEACTEMGFCGANLIAMQGPFSHELNAAMIRQLGVSWLVTKDSGEVGGFYQKLSAVEETGIQMLLVRRPIQESGYSPEEMEKEVCEAYNVSATLISEENPKAHPRFPLFVDIGEMPVTVLGGGKVATRRVGTLVDCGAVVTVIAPQITAELQELAKSGVIFHHNREYAPGDLAKTTLAVIATDSPLTNIQATEEAKRLGIPHSTAYHRDKGSFWFPALLHQDNLAIGLVSVDGDHIKVRQAAEKIRRKLGETQ